MKVADAKNSESGANGTKRPNGLLIKVSRFWLESTSQEEQKNLISLLVWELERVKALTFVAQYVRPKLTCIKHRKSTYFMAEKLVSSLSCLSQINYIFSLHSVLQLLRYENTVRSR
jgi:hypothetical protein